MGRMGYPMARNLLRAGHEVALWSHTAEKAVRLAGEENGIFRQTPREVAADAECVFVCVGNTEMSRQVILGEEGLIEGATQGCVVADASTIGPSASRKIGEALAARGVDFLDTPCTGSVGGAEGGTLMFMIGGQGEVFQRVKPFYEAMGTRFYHCGGPGMGLQAKLSQNLIQANLLIAFNECMVLAAKGGIEPELMLEILDNSAAKSGLVSFKAPYVLRRDFSTKFSNKLMHKDLALSLESGFELGVPLTLTGLTHQIFQTAISSGLGDEDMCSTIKVLEELAGVELKGR